MSFFLFALPEIVCFACFPHAIFTHLYVCIYISIFPPLFLCSEIYFCISIILIHIYFNVSILNLYTPYRVCLSTASPDRQQTTRNRLVPGCTYNIWVCPEASCAPSCGNTVILCPEPGGQKKPGTVWLRAVQVIPLVLLDAYRAGKQLSVRGFQVVLI